MECLWIASILASIPQVYNQIIREDKCQLFVTSFDWVVKGRLTFGKMTFPKTAMSLGRCISSCVHFESERGVKECRSINYNPALSQCEVFKKELTMAVPAILFKDEAPLFEDVSGWFHYSPNPNTTMVGPKCAAEGNPCGVGKCTDTCDSFKCECNVEQLKEDDVCKLKDPKSFCKLNNFIGREMTVSDNNQKLNVKTATEIEAVDGTTYTFELDPTEEGCVFVESTTRASTISFLYKTCQFYDSHNSLTYSLDTCDYKEAQKLVGLYDHGKIFVSRYGIHGGFRIKSNKLDHLLDGTVTGITTTDAGDFQIAVNFYNQFELTGLIDCTIILKRFDDGETMTWRKIGCQIPSVTPTPTPSL
ncbi:uncharacterized protein [Clytia hemisphaerica]